MNARCLYYLSIALLLIAAKPVHAYTHADSVKAKAYFDSSWYYPLHSTRHQLFLDSALMILPKYAWYWQQKSMPLYKMQKYQAGHDFLDSAVKYDRARWLDYRAFMKCIYEKDYRGALGDFYAVKAMPGNNSSVMDHPYDFYIGVCHLQLNNYDSALYYLQSCVDAEARTLGEKWVHYNHLYYLGVVNYERTDYKAALSCFDRALKGYDKFSDAKYYKALCMRQLGDSLSSITPVMEEAYNNFRDGYSMNEDNVIYESYPYQVKKYSYTAALEFLHNTEKKKQ